MTVCLRASPLVRRCVLTQSLCALVSTDVVAVDPGVRVGTGAGAGAGAGATPTHRAAGASRVPKGKELQVLKRELALPRDRILVFRNGRRVRKAEMSLVGMPFYKQADNSRVGCVAWLLLPSARPVRARLLSGCMPMCVSRQCVVLLFLDGTAELSPDKQNFLTPPMVPKVRELGSQ